MIKKYPQFIKENYSDIKSDLISYIDSNKSDIESKGLDFNKIRNNITDMIENLDSNFLEIINSKLSSIDINNKSEFQHKFEEIIKLIIQELSKSQLNESISSFFHSIWNEIKKAIRWISDRIYTISGSLTLGLGTLLLIITQWGDGIGIPTDFANVAVNGVLILGVIIIKYGQENDKYKNYSVE
jgi:hypothetical protein